jgi:hypothetical protein
MNISYHPFHSSYFLSNHFLRCYSIVRGFIVPDEFTKLKNGSNEISILFYLEYIHNRVWQRLFGFTSGWLGRTSGDERWSHFLTILLSRNELIAQALHLSFSRYSFASKHIQFNVKPIITNGMKKHGRWWCWWSLSHIFAWFSSIVCSYLIYFIFLLILHLD